MFATQRAMKKSSLGLWPYNTNWTFLQNFEKIWSARSWLRFFVGNTFASTLSKQPVTITLTRFLSWQKTSPQKNYFNHEHFSELQLCRWVFEKKTPIFYGFSRRTCCDLIAEHVL